MIRQWTLSTRHSESRTVHTIADDSGPLFSTDDPEVGRLAVTAPELLIAAQDAEQKLRRIIIPLLDSLATWSKDDGLDRNRLALIANQAELAANHLKAKIVKATN